MNNKKVETIPVQTRINPVVSWSMRLPDFKMVSTWRW